MRIALLSDIHANAAALEAVLAAVDALAPDHIFVLGDLVGRGPEPQRVAELIEASGARTLRGNWDEWAHGAEGWDERPKRKIFVEAARALMKKKALAFVGEAPQRRRLILDGVTLVLAHGSPRNPMELLGPDSTDAQLEAAIAGTRADIVAVGHSHKAFARRLGDTLVVNTGTVGYPFNGDPRACFALLEFSGREDIRVEHIRVPYKLRSNLRAMKRVVKRGLVPPELALRYRRALLGEGPEPYQALSGEDSGSDALVKLLVRRVRAVYAGPPIEDVLLDAVRVRDLRLATRKLREALALARPLCAVHAFDRAVTPLTELGHQLGQRRTADVLAHELKELGAGALMVAVETRRKRTTARLLAHYSPETMVGDGLALTALAMRPRDETTSVRELAQALLSLRKTQLEAALPALARQDAREGHHLLRIQLRRLRHGTDLMREAMPAPLSAELEVIAVLAKTMHAALGKLNDAYEVTRFLESRRVSRVLDGALLAQLAAAAAERLHARFLEADARVKEHVDDLLGRLGRTIVELR